jgi:hypothetical protein
VQALFVSKRGNAGTVRITIKIIEQIAMKIIEQIAMKNHRADRDEKSSSRSR